MPTINWSYLCLALFLGLMASLCWQIGRTESPTESSTVLAWGGVAGYVLAGLLVVRGILELLVRNRESMTTRCEISGSRSDFQRPTQLVELWAAWCWTCDACGKDNFERSVTAEITEEDAQMYASKYGMEPEEFLNGEWHTKPVSVTCDHCQSQYLVEQINEEEA